MNIQHQTTICFYFQVHQPFRLKKDYDFFKMGVDHDFIDHETNKVIIKRVTENCYLKTNRILLDAIRKHGEKIRLAFSISGTALEQFELYCPEVITSFQELAESNNVEFLAETYHHSLSSVVSSTEFCEQVELHREKIRSLFYQDPTTFRNTELIYSNSIAQMVANLGFRAMLAEGVDRVLNWRSSNFLYCAKDSNLKLLLKNYLLSDEIAFRFSNPFWRKEPLQATEFLSLLNQHAQNGANYLGLFMDYETFGEHQRQEDGIFKFLVELLDLVAWSENLIMHTPREIQETSPCFGTIDIPNATSWADRERDLSAWLGNPMQNASAKLLYSMENDIKKTGNTQLLQDWRKLLTSDHSYYTCTKYFGDGAVHNYFSPYLSPYDAFVVYSNAINDVRIRLDKSLSSS